MHALLEVRNGELSCGARDKTPGQPTQRQTVVNLHHKPAVAALCSCCGGLCVTTTGFSPPQMQKTEVNRRQWAHCLKSLLSQWVTLALV